MPILYATGAYIAPHHLPNGSWAWIVTGFEDDTFQDGVEVDIPVTADTWEELVTPKVEED